MRIVKKAAFLAAILALTGGCGERAVTRVEGRGLAIETRLDPPAPRTGENRIHVRLVDENGASVTGAEVEVAVTMPAMGAMPAMGGPAQVTPKGDGRYEAVFTLDMEGTWRVAISAQTDDGRSLRAAGSLLTGHEGLRLSLHGAQDEPPRRGGEPHQQHGRGEHDGHDASAAPGEVFVDPARWQKTGIRTAAIRSEPFGVTIRTVGIVAYDQGTLHDVAPRVAGYVGQVAVPAVGEAVRAGDLLFTLYSPDLLAAQKEFLTALASERTGSPAAGARSGAVTAAARSRLRLWGMAGADIDRIAASGIPLEYVPFRSGASGVVVEKVVVDGSGTQAGERVFRIAAIDRVWIEADLYEADLPLVTAGTPARIRLPYLPGERIDGTVSFVSPALDEATRTARARIAVANPGGALLPGMYASVELHRDLGDRLVAPASAILYAGDRRFVFVDLGAGRLRPAAVETGLRDGDRIELVSGVEAGQKIVVSGNYLVASESRLGSALEQW